MKKILLFLFVLFAVQYGFSQTGKHAGNSYSEITNSPVPNPQVSEIVKNIKTARINNDLVSQRFWEAKLQELTHPKVIF